MTPGEELASRPPIVRELLQYMKSDDRHFSANFNILHLTVKKVSEGFIPMFFVPYQHVKMGAFTSVALYHKVIGQGDWNWMDNSKKEFGIRLLIIFYQLTLGLIPMLILVCPMLR